MTARTASKMGTDEFVATSLTRRQTLPPVAACVLAVALGILVAVDGPLAVGLTALALCAIAVLAAPGYSALALVVCWPALEVLVPGSLAHFGPVGLDQAWAAVLVAASCLYAFVPRAAPTPPVHAARLPVAFLCTYAAAALLHPGREHAAYFTVRLAAWVGLCFASERLAQSRRGQELIAKTGLLAAAVLVVAIGLLIAEGRYGLGYYNANSEAATGSSPVFPHVYALMALLLLPLPLSRLRSRRHAWASALLAGVLALCVMLSFVRSAYVGLLVILVVFSLASITARRGIARFVAVALVAGLGLLGMLYQSFLISRFADLAFLRASGATSGRAGNGRLWLWRVLLSNSADSAGHVVFGHGAWYSIDASARTIGLAIWAHNDFLEMFLTGGVLLLATYSATVAWAFLSAFRLARDRRHTQAARSFGLLAAAGVVAFAAVSFTNGAAFYLSTVALSLGVGLVRGMRRTPGMTWLDRE